MDITGAEKRKPNPRETANVFSLISFAYTANLFKKAYKQELEEEDLYAVLTQCRSKKCGGKMEKEWIIEHKKNPERPVSLLKLLWKRYGLRYTIIGIIQLVWTISWNIAEPWSLSNLIAYFSPGQTELTKYDAYFYAATLLTVYFVGCVFLHNYILMVVQMGIEIKTSFSSMLYRKTLRLTPSAVADITLGNIVTLITKDVHVFQQSVWVINDTWVGFVELFVICYLLYGRLGPLSFVGVGILVGIMPVQVLLGRYIGKLRLGVGKKTDERLQVTQETLSAIRIIKMYTWEAFFGDKIKSARKIEASKMSFVFFLRYLIIILGKLFSKLGLYALVMCYVWSGGVMEPKTIFYILSMFKELTNSVGIYIPYGLGQGAEFLSAMTRINKVINGEELPPKIGSDEPTDRPLVEIKDGTVHIKDVEILKKVSLRIDSGLTLVTGTVGSGKTSLLKALLQDYPLTFGTLNTQGRISYASQDPWLFPSSIRQNILFGQQYDEKRYQEIVKVCALEYDFSLFEHGDQTIVTDKGLNLSKGQQSRVNLARAIYKESEIYLLDDSLTALDAHVQDYIFNECMKTYLKDKICILVTQTANHIKESDNVVIMDKGQIKSHGKPVGKILEDINEMAVEDDDLEKEVVEENVKEKEEDESEKKETDKLLETEQTAQQNIYREVQKKGKVDISTYKRYCVFGGGLVLFTFTLGLCAVAQFSESYSDQLITKWVDQQHEVLVLRGNLSNLAKERNATVLSNNLTQIILNKRSAELENSTETTKINFLNTFVFSEILSSLPIETTTKFSTIVTEATTSVSLMVSNLSTAIVPNSTITTVAKLLNDSVMEQNSSNVSVEVLLDEAIAQEQSTIRVYSIMIFISIALIVTKSYALFNFCRRASINMHKAMVNSAINAVMSFYDTHFIGNVLNRFSQDLNNIDEVLPFVFNDMFRIISTTSGIIFLIALVNLKFLVHAAIFIVIVYILRTIYLPTGRSLKRLEAATRSPMIGHLNASLDGLTTIRAYKAQETLIDEFDRHQDLYTSAHYTSICTSRAFGMCIDYFCTALIASVVFRFLFVDTDNTAGKVGLALTQILLLAGSVQWGVRQWSELENLMTSVERLIEYTEIKPEKKEGVEVQDWPTNGAVEYEGVSLSYNNTETVLKNLNFFIEPKQKIGIVGRTGAGKSSIISTIFKLYDVQGKIRIDGVNIKSVAVQYLRKRIGIIPQDPVLFSGTIRTNLDPFGEYTDDVLWTALDRVGLKGIVSNLDLMVSSSSNYSSGQKQLVCLARAILRKVKIVVLDEATANMDHETDVFLNKTVQDNFAKCTIFIIAHRLHSVLECDKVMVLHRGEIKEFDSPVTLLEKKDGMFYKMVEQAGLLDYLS